MAPKKEKIYMHIETGETDTKQGWVYRYDAEELDIRDISSEDAFLEDVGNTLFEVTSGQNSL